MPIVVDSSHWTGDDDSGAGSPMVWGEFAERAALERAAERLQGEGWFRAIPAAISPHAPAEQDQKETNRQNLRQNFVGIGAAATSLAAAGIVIATGGAALPAVAAAAAAGGTALAAGEAAGAAAPRAAPELQTKDARREGPALGIPAGTPALRDRAEEFLRQAGATRVWLQATPAG